MCSYTCVFWTCWYQFVISNYLATSALCSGWIVNWHPRWQQRGDDAIQWSLDLLAKVQLSGHSSGHLQNSNHSWPCYFHLHVSTYIELNVSINWMEIQVFLFVFPFSSPCFSFDFFSIFLCITIPFGLSRPHAGPWQHPRRS